MINLLVLLFFAISAFCNLSLMASPSKEGFSCELAFKSPGEAAIYYSDLLIQSRQADNESMKTYQMYMLEQFILSEFRSQDYIKAGQTYVSLSGFRAEKLNPRLGPEQIKAYLIDRFFRFYLVPLTFQVTVKKETHYFQIQLNGASVYNSQKSKEGVFYPDINLVLAFSHLTRQDLLSNSLTQSERVMTKPFNSIGKDRLFVTLNRLFDPHVFNLDEFFKLHSKEKKYVREDDVLGPVDWIDVFKHYPQLIHRIIEIPDGQVKNSLQDHLSEEEINKLLKYRLDLILAFKASEVKLSPNPLQ